MDSRTNRPSDVVKYKKLLEEGYDEAEARRITGVTVRGDPAPEQSSEQLNDVQDPNSDVDSD